VQVPVLIDNRPGDIKTGSERLLGRDGRPVIEDALDLGAVVRVVGVVPIVAITEPQSVRVPLHDRMIRPPRRASKGTKLGRKLRPSRPFHADHRGCSKGRV